MAFTTEERIALVKRKAQANKERLDEIQRSEAKECEKLEAQLHALFPRISSLFAVANTCHAKDVLFPTAKETISYGWGVGTTGFYVDKVNHNIGFTGYKLKQGALVSPILIGLVDEEETGFYVNHNNCIISMQKGKISKHSARKDDMQKFLAQFDTFEEAFYKWIDSFATE